MSKRSNNLHGKMTGEMKEHIFRLPGNSEWIAFGIGIKKIACE